MAVGRGLVDSDRFGHAPGERKRLPDRCAVCSLQQKQLQQHACLERIKEAGADEAPAEEVLL